MAKIRKTVRFPIDQYRRLEAEAAAMGIPVGTWMSIKLEDSFYADHRQRRIEVARRRLATVTTRSARTRRPGSTHPFGAPRGIGDKPLRMSPF